MVARTSCALCVEMLFFSTSKPAVVVLALLYFGLYSGEDDLEEEVGDKGKESEVSESEDSETVLCVCVLQLRRAD